MAQGNYANVNGLRMYYEVHGKGDPLVLLHGGVGGLEMLGAILPALAEHRRVIAPDFQAHGRTADIDRPLRYEFMADDIAALLSHLGVEQADVMGTSLGAGIGLQLAIRHPERVRKLVLVSRTFRQDGWYPAVQASFAHMGPAAAEGLKQSPLAQIYPAVDWGALFTKIHDLETREYDYSKGLAALRMPVLLIFADADAIQPKHIMEFYELLGGGQRDAGLDGSGRPINQLAILPGLTHYTIETSPGLAATAVPFLDAPLSSAYISGTGF